MWRRPNNPAIICEMVSVAEPASPPTKENTGMIELMPGTFKSARHDRKTTIRMTCGVYAPYALRYRRTKCETPLGFIGVYAGASLSACAIMDTSCSNVTFDFQKELHLCLVVVSAQSAWTSTGR